MIYIAGCCCYLGGRKKDLDEMNHLLFRMNNFGRLHNLILVTFFTHTHVVFNIIL